MKQEEVTHAEKLFGRLARDVLSGNRNSYPQPFQTNSSKASLFLTFMFYGYYVLSSMKIINETINYIIILPLIATSIGLSYLKSQILFNNYAPDLEDMDINYTKFGLMQSSLSHLFMIFLSIVVAMMIGVLSNFSYSYFAIIFYISFISVIYVNFSDLGMITLGFGNGIIPVNTSIVKLYNNFKNFTSVNNQFSIKTAIVRIFYIMIIFAGVYVNLSIWVMILFPILYAYMIYPLEVKNASLIFTRIRGKINELIPGSIPDDTIIDDDTPYPLAVPTRIRPVAVTNHQGNDFNYPSRNIPSQPERIIANQSQPSIDLNYKRNKPNKPPEDLSPYAARTLDKIINKVRTDGPMQKRGLSHCVNCGVVVNTSHTLCTICSINK